MIELLSSSLSPVGSSASNSTFFFPTRNCSGAGGETCSSARSIPLCPGIRLKQTNVVPTNFSTASLHSETSAERIPKRRFRLSEILPLAAIMPKQTNLCKLFNYMAFDTFPTVVTRSLHLLVLITAVYNQSKI